MHISGPRPLLRAIPSAALLLSLAAGGMPAAEPDPQEILRKADEARFPQRDYEVNVTVTSSAPGREPEVRKYQILSKGNDRTLVMTTAPPVDRGQTLLMRERDLFLYMPGISAPIRLPLSQRATGQVANGDLARANFAGDYDATIARVDEVDGEPSWVLELTAAQKGLTYPKLLYWVDQKTYRPSRAEFYSLSGRLLKRCRYEKYVEAGGGRRPSIVTMEDALTEGATSVLEYRGFRLVDLPDKMFTKDYLKKI